MGRLGRLGLLVAAVVLAATACANASSPGSSPAPTIRPSQAGGSNGPLSPVVGTVASVDPAAQASPAATPTKASAKPGKSAPPTPNPTFSKVRGFTLLTTGGETLTFTIGELDNADEFPPDSLYDRVATEDPIRVFFTAVGDTLVVYHIEDAG